MADPTCSIEGCGKPYHARGWCSSHYSKWSRWGDPLAVTTRRKPNLKRRIPVEHRFWDRVDKSGECWLWTGSRRHAYGEIQVDARKHYTHRVAWELANGRPLQKGEVVRHRCDVPLCVNPAHLLVGTQLDNARDMAERGRWRNQTTAGPNNDPFQWAHRRRSA